MNKTNIEYLDLTWNPIVMRCTPIAEGCKNCWHLRMADRLAGMNRQLRDIYSGKSKPYLDLLRLTEPLYRKKPAKIGTQFMGDLFHKNITRKMFHSIEMSSE